MQGILGRDNHDPGRDLIFVNNCGLNEFGPFGHLKDYVCTFVRAPVVQKLDSTIHRINHYPVDKC